MTRHSRVHLLTVANNALFVQKNKLRFRVIRLVGFMDIIQLYFTTKNVISKIEKKDLTKLTQNKNNYNNSQS